MRKLLLILCCLFVGQLHAQTVLVIGDSLSAAYGIPAEEGWVALLDQRLSHQGLDYHVVNASISGDTTQGGLTRLPAALKQFKPDVVIIELGGNDGLRGINLQTTRNNLADMIELAQQSGSRVLLLGMMLPPNFGKAFTEKFQQIYRDLAEQYQLQLVPFFLHGVAERPEWMQADGIHPKSEGQPTMLENVWPQLQELLVSESS